MSALTKAEMSEHLCTELGLTRRQAKVLVDRFFEVLCEWIVSGEPVRLSGFGNFEVRQKSQRPGRNPKTGEVVPVSARRVVTFKAGQKMRQQVELRYASLYLTDESGSS